MRSVFELDDNRPHEQGKVVPLSQAIALCVRPGMKIHINTGAYANAAIREIIRQYWGKDPGFTLISSGVTTPYKISLACSGLVKKVITTNHSYTYPKPKPIPLLRKLQKDGQLDLEVWSLYSLEQRLMAGALGVGFMPTRSLVGTTVAQENKEYFAMIDDPFNPGSSIGAVKALCPDISIIHGCVADCDGNTILAPPYFASIWGARASKDGVLVTVEKIVGKETIRKYSSLVKIPAHLVRFVAEVPFGAHPQGLAAETIGIVEGYGEDYDFIESFVESSQSREDLGKWVQEWILDTANHDEYLQRLGTERILLLKGKSSIDAWRYERLPEQPHKSEDIDYNTTEMMIIAGAREVVRLVRENRYTNVLAGIGSPALSAWVAYYLLKQNGEKIHLLTGLGHVGYEPRPGDPFLMTLSNTASSTMLTDTTEIYGTFVGGAHNRCLSVVGTAQIDKYGNINTVKMGNYNLIGLGGAGDAVNAQHTLVVTKQSHERFMEKLPYIGCSGKSIRTLVTDLGVFEKLRDDNVFTLIKYIRPSENMGKEEICRHIEQECGWDMKFVEELEPIAPPTAEEIGILRALDPKGLFVRG